MRGFIHIGWVKVVISREDAKKIGVTSQHAEGVLLFIQKGYHFA